MLFAFPPAHAETATCSVKTFTSDCAKFATAPLDLKGADGFGLPASQERAIVLNPVSARQTTNATALAALATLTPADEQALGQTTHELLVVAQELVVGDTQKEYWTPEQRSMIERLKDDTLRVVLLPAKDETCTKNVPVGYPAARFDVATNSVHVCPSVARLERSQMARVLAPVIAKALSPCALSSKLVEAVKAGASGSSAQNLEKCLQNQNVKKETLVKAAARFAKVRVTLLPNGDATSEALESCQLMKTRAEGVEKPGLFQDVESCIERAQTSAWKSSQGLAEDATGGPNKIPLKCFGPVVSGFSDALGSRMVARLIERRGTPATSVRAGLIGLAALACVEKGNTGPASVRLRTALSDNAVQAQLQCQGVEGPAVCTLAGYQPGGATGAGTPKKNGTTP